MRTSDWSSDVYSSDLFDSLLADVQHCRCLGLADLLHASQDQNLAQTLGQPRYRRLDAGEFGPAVNLPVRKRRVAGNGARGPDGKCARKECPHLTPPPPVAALVDCELGRASCTERVCRSG